MPHPPISFLLPTHPVQVCAGNTRVATPKADKLKGDREEKQRIQKKKQKQKQQVQTRKTSHGNRNPQLENPWQRVRRCPCPGPVSVPGVARATAGDNK